MTGSDEGLHAQRARAESFGGAAEAYDRSRPSYPPSLVDAVLIDGPARALDVGCGTGKAGRLLLARGVEVLGVEPDARMAEQARRHGLAVEVATFETWDVRGRTFPLLVAGQSWHWVDPEAGADRAAAMLDPGGRWAAFWNDDAFPPDVRAELDALYERWFPESVAPVPARDQEHAERRLGPGAEAIDAHPVFGPVETSVHRWHEVVTAGQLVERIGTYSDHLALPAARREPLLAGIAGIVDARGGQIEIRHDTLLATAVRSA